MNKFFTLGLGVILVLVGKGIVWGQMTNETIPQPPVISVATTTSSGLPKPLDLSRFDALRKKSPFTLASATANAAFAKELVLGGYFRMDGQDFVIVANNTNSERILVGQKPSPGARGMVLLDLKKDPLGNPSKLEAKIQKGTEMATLGYPKQDGGNTPAASPPVPAQGQPAILGASGQQPGQVQVNPGDAPSAIPYKYRGRQTPIVPNFNK